MLLLMLKEPINAKISASIMRQGLFSFYTYLEMTKEGTFTMISRVVVARHLGRLLCAVGPWFRSFNLTFLRYILGGAEF